jgi:hypothetical protein
MSMLRLKAGMCSVACVVAILLCGKFCARGEDVPNITGFVRTNPAYCVIWYTNCNDTNFDYYVQRSSNLVDWVDARAVRGAATNTTVIMSAPCLPGKQNFHRVVKTPHIPVPIFPMAIMVSSNINFIGNNILIDSFDSSDTNHSTAGQYDATKRSDHGDVGTDLIQTTSFNLGNTAIYGKIHTGPGSLSSTVAVGPYGSVGDLAWQDGGNVDIQPGAWLYDMNVTFPSITAPPGSGIPPISGIYQGTSYDYLLSTPNGFYTLNSALAGKVMVTGTNAVLWAKGGVNLKGPTSGILLAPGASLALYVGDNSGASVTATFSSAFGANTNGFARNLQVYGLPTCTGISVGLGSQFCGIIYAPQADFTGSGGSGSLTHFYGSLIAKSVSTTSRCAYHYDESLLKTGPYR